MPHQSPAEELEQALTVLRASSRHRVLEELEFQEFRDTGPAKQPSMALVIDVETTGVLHGQDRVIQLAAQPFHYCRSGGFITKVLPPLCFFDDPKIPIPELIQKLTGITDAMVVGQSIDERAIISVAEASDLIIAHNAAFDRPFVESRLAKFPRRQWACSMTDVPWLEECSTSAKALEHLLFRVCGKFYDAHAADADCLAVVELLATQFPSGNSAMSALLAASRRQDVRISAIGAPFDKKDLLKSRRYSWFNGSATRDKAWRIELSADRQESELAWLEANVYAEARRRVLCEPLSPMERFSGATS